MNMTATYRRYKVCVFSAERRDDEPRVPFASIALFGQLCMAPAPWVLILEARQSHARGCHQRSEALRALWGGRNGVAPHYLG